MSSPLNLAFSLHQSGKLDEAERLYRQILSSQPNHIDANHLLGVLAHQRQKYPEAIAYIQTAIRLNPQNPDFYSNLGEAWRLSGDLEAAINNYQKALKIQPNNAKTHFNLGNAMQAQGKNDLAINAYQTAIDLMPNLAPAHHNLGFLQFQNGEISAAINSYRTAISHNPKYAQALNNLGNALQAAGQILEALEIYLQALEITPDSAEIYNDLGNALQANYDFDRAIVVYQKAIALKSDFAVAFYNLGNAYKIKTQAAEAEASYQQAILLKPDCAEWYVTLGDLWREQNRLDEAIAIWQTALKCKPDLLEAKLKIAVALPIFYETTEEILVWRERFRLGLAQFCQDLVLDSPPKIKAALKAIQNSTNFYLAYQAQDDLQLQIQYGNLLHRIMAAAYPQFAQPEDFLFVNSGQNSIQKPDQNSDPKVSAETKIRLGFVSSYFRNHTVGKLFLGWLQNCGKTNQINQTPDKSADNSAQNQAQFEIYCYYTGKMPTPATEAFAAASDFIYHLPQVEAAIRQIAQDKLDILVFTDLGMNPETMQIAALRLAPVQCVAWGHPVTSGLPTIDYFLSSALMEPPDADAHYRENLIRLPHLSICYERPELPQNPIPRAQFQIPDDAVVYLCCQSLFKYLPQYDYIFVEIAKRVPKAKFVFITSNNGDFVTQQFQKRLQSAFAQLGSDQEFCLIMPRLDRYQYLSLNLIADVFLDTIDWSGGNTSLEAFACNLPVVTLPKKFMRSRHSLAMLQILGIAETIAETEAEYIEIAVKLGLDEAWRVQIAQKIAQKINSDELYHDQTSVKALSEFFVSKSLGVNL